MRHGIVLPNSPGTIDEDYHSEIQVIVLNANAEPFVVERGARIAQGVLAPVMRMAWEEVGALEATERNAGGDSAARDGRGTTPAALPANAVIHALMEMDLRVQPVIR